MTSLVVFTDNPVGHFTHCYAIVDDRHGNLISVDCSWGVIDVGVVGDDKIDLHGHYNYMGFPTLRVEKYGDRIYCPVMPISCVSFIKRIFGIRAPFVLTSKQLYNYLRTR